MKITRLYTNSKNESALEEIEIPMERVAVELFPGHKAEQTAILSTPSAMILNETDPGHQYDWHNAPRRQLVVTIQGEIEVLLRDNYSKKFGAGDIILAEDLTGSGHMTKVISTIPWRCIYLPFDGALSES